MYVSEAVNQVVKQAEIFAKALFYSELPEFYAKLSEYFDEASYEAEQDEYDDE